MSWCAAGPSSFTRRTWLRALAVAPLVTVPTLTAGCATGTGAPAARASDSGTSSAGTSSARTVAEEQSAVDRVIAAVRAGDEPAYRALLGRADRAFAGTTDALWRNLNALRPERLQITVSARRQPLSTARAELFGADASSTEATLTWRLAGQTRPAQTVVWLTFTGAADRIRWSGTTDVPAITGPRLPVPLWWLEPVTVDAGARVVLLRSTGVPAPSGSTWPRLVRAAAAQAVRHLTAPVAEPVVVELPGDLPSFARASGQPDATSLAAITVSSGPDPAAPAKVVVNRATATGPIEPLGFTLTHELVHAVTDAPARPAPMWCEEGTADAVAFDAYPALADAELGRLRSSLDGRAPRLPGDDAFAPGAPQLDRSYALAWSACRFLAVRHGWRALQRIGDRLALERDTRWWRDVDYRSLDAFHHAWAAWLGEQTAG